MKSTPHDECTRVVLVANDSTNVELCTSCRTVTVEVGAVSIRFDPVTLRRLHGTIGDALDCADELWKSLDKAKESEVTPAPLFPNGIPRGNA